MPESIELATILVTDLVGSTRLANSVGPVRADELRDEHFDVLREAVGASGGREFRSTGDGMMVAFSSASAAVRCAVSMQQLIERRYRRAEPKLQVRIGLGVGESTVQDASTSRMARASPFYGGPANKTVASFRSTARGQRCSTDLPVMVPRSRRPSSQASKQTRELDERK